jgi:hypothetical protein
MLDSYGEVAMYLAPLIGTFEGTFESLPTRAALNHSVPLSTSTPVMGESQKIKRTVTTVFLIR